MSKPRKTLNVKLPSGEKLSLNIQRDKLRHKTLKNLTLFEIEHRKELYNLANAMLTGKWNASIDFSAALERIKTMLTHSKPLELSIDAIEELNSMIKNDIPYFSNINNKKLLHLLKKHARDESAGIESLEYEVNEEIKEMQEKSSLQTRPLRIFLVMRILPYFKSYVETELEAEYRLLNE